MRRAFGFTGFGFGGLASEPAPAVGGLELVTNGGFDDETGWTVNNFSGTTSIGGGKLHLSDPADDGDSVSQAISIEAGHTYRVSYSITARTGGGSRIGLGGVTGTIRNTIAAHQEEIVAVSTSDLVIVPSLANGIEIDNVSVQEVL